MCRSVRPQLCLTASRRSCALGVKAPRSASAKAAALSACKWGWLRLGPALGLRGPQVLHDGGLATDGIDRDYGPLQNHAVEQAEDGRNLVALGSWARGNPPTPGRHSPDAGAVQQQGCPCRVCLRWSADLFVTDRSRPMTETGQLRFTPTPRLYVCPAVGSGPLTGSVKSEGTRVLGIRPGTRPRSCGIRIEFQTRAWRKRCQDSVCPHP